MALNILIVDDSPAMRAFVRRVMQLSGLGVENYFEAANGAEALEITAVQRLDAILTDINMPVMDGEEFVRHLRSDPDPGAATPVIVVSTDATAHRIRNLLELGASGYLQKPFGPEQLRGEVERVLYAGEETPDA
ncbi:MAG TPA: response regulator [Bryobacteraceae bacterium]|nr:response regulator [Bryobacteraceae bacterium]